MIPMEKFPTVAKAIEAAHYPGIENPTGQAFELEAKSFIAAFNACEQMHGEEQTNSWGDEKPKWPEVQDNKLELPVTPVNQSPLYVPPPPTPPAPAI